MDVLEVGVFAVIFSVFIREKVDSFHFGYSKNEQYMWRKTYSKCGGVLQSPIPILSDNAIPLLMPALELIRYHNLLPEPLKLHNNGHSVSLSVPWQETPEQTAEIMPYVFGGRLTDEYELEGLHFHWGNKNNLGSEHTFNDVRFPMEMHIIHRNRKYRTTAEALEHRDGLTVLAFFYQLSERENKKLAQIVKALPFVQEFNKEVTLNDTFRLSKLLPDQEKMEHFYTYQGSLTTPPCSEAVTWILFPDPLPVSLAQMKKFRSLSTNTVRQRLVNNYREMQQVGQRRVFIRKLKHKGQRLNGTVHYMKWDWLN